MQMTTLVPSLLIAAHHAASQSTQDGETLPATQDPSLTITSAVPVTCPTGDPRSKWASCSSSVSSAMNNCANDDLPCACTRANAGFNCLTTYCPAHTSAICQASLALHGLCALANAPGPTLTHLTCPTDIPNLLADLVPSSARSLLPSAWTGALLPSEIGDVLATEIPLWNGGEDGRGTSESGRVSEGNAEAATATATGVDTGGVAPDSGSAAGRIGGLETVLGVGVGVSVVVVGLAAWV